MPIIFSRHALEQMRRRKISQNKVINIVSHSHQKVSSFRDQKLRQMLVGGKLLEVVTKTEGNKITVIRAYFLEKSL